MAYVSPESDDGASDGVTMYYRDRRRRRRTE